ncbi:MAG: exodeoxyribonuclease V subunit alpha [Methyloprofundus sp.]|nr:exodeoxyribonuclease V subunit alpha [Methyloprofundus sp.]
MKNEFSFNRIDLSFAEFLIQKTKLEKDNKLSFKKLIARLSSAKAEGHSCLIVSEEEQALLQLSGVADSTGGKPLVLEHEKLYFQRYWQYEVQLAQEIQHLIGNKIELVNSEVLLDQYFPTKITDEIDWQKEAAKAAINNRLTIITGGPGTGKTTTVVKILALLQELSSGSYLNIGLVAPTGKAAMRLKESILKSKSSLNCTEGIKARIPDKAQTIHRLLGVKRFSPYFKYNQCQRLPFDLIIVDEASMIDLPLMGKLFSALAENSRIILLGDKHQLSSVETGSVLSDLSEALITETQELKKSYRFSGNIKHLAVAINEENSEEAWQIVEAAHNDASLLDSDLIDYIVEKKINYFKLIKDDADFKSIYTEFSRFQVLCATRKGRFSVEDINSRTLKSLKKAKKVMATTDWYIGRPILITQNSPALDLYNGDIGICLLDENKLVVCFLMPDGSVKKYLPARLPHCETVFAMTIHKSQGSEFEEVLLVLPEKITPILTKELIYTGVTRAKNKIQIASNKTVFTEAVNRKVERNSGLIERINM